MSDDNDFLDGIEPIQIEDEFTEEELYAHSRRAKRHLKDRIIRMNFMKADCLATFGNVPETPGLDGMEQEPDE